MLKWAYKKSAVTHYPYGPSMPCSQTVTSGAFLIIQYFSANFMDCPWNGLESIPGNSICHVQNVINWEIVVWRNSACCLSRAAVSLLNDMVFFIFSPIVDPPFNRVHYNYKISVTYGLFTPLTDRVFQMCTRLLYVFPNVYFPSQPFSKRVFFANIGPRPIKRL